MSAVEAPYRRVEQIGDCTLYLGDCLDVLLTMPDAFVQCVVTSPPYFGLRDYGVDGQIGLEKTPAEYVEKLVLLFREVRRVLKDDGTVWLNLGDSYVTQGGRGEARMVELGRPSPGAITQPAARGAASGTKASENAKPKDLIGIPWRVAFALQADGWYLRQDIIWHKPNPMPESVTDRCTKSHEYIFLLSKSAKYYYNAGAIAEPFADERMGNPGDYTDRYSTGSGRNDAGRRNKAWNVGGERDSRNRRSVWTVATQPFSGAHFATFPPKLIEPCILAGSRPDDVVLDPFGGAGTTAIVAGKLNRRSVLIELNSEYVELSKKRIRAEYAQGDFFRDAKPAKSEQLGLIE